MKIVINETYYIAVDTYNYTLMEKYEGTKGEGDQQTTVERTRSLGYYPNVEHALMFLAKYTLVQGGETLRISEYLKELRIIQKELIDAVKGVAE